jgi:poly(3-hydroxybutyrate) depolymerase
MFTKWLPVIALGSLIGIAGCGSSPLNFDSGVGGSPSGGASAGGASSGGASSGGAASGGRSSGGSASGGATSGGASSGGSSSGGASSAGGAASGGSATGGGSPVGGGDGAGGAASGGNSGGPGDVRPSQGCNVADGPDKLTAGGASVNGALPTSVKLSINTGGSNRDYIVDIPEDYDPTHPYRLIFSWHQAYGSSDGNATGQYPAFNGPNFNAQNYAFFGLHRESREANDPVIFVAPQGIGNFPWDYNRDVQLFDDVLAKVTENLCIDESRVFTTGFSFGAMMSHALSLGRASKLRGAVTMAPANYNFTQPTNEPANIAYFGITGMGDTTCRWVNNDGQKTGGKYCVLTHAEDNECTVNTNFQTAAGGSRNHVCYDFEGCKEGYPVKVCTFDGAHTPSSVSDGMSSGDDGLNAFIPPLAWDFISKL